MASATITKVKPVETKSYVIELTQEEAEALQTLVGSTNGKIATDLLHGMWNQLYNLNVTYTKYRLTGHVNTISLEKNV